MPVPEKGPEWLVAPALGSPHRDGHFVPVPETGPEWLVAPGLGSPRGQQARPLHRLEPDRPGFLAAGAARQALDHPGRAGSRDLALDRTDALVALVAELFARPGEQLGEERHQGICAIEGEIPTAGAAWVIERLPSGAGRAEARDIWLEAMQRPGLLAPARA